MSHSPQRESFASLKKKIADLERDQDKARYEFRNDLESVIRAQHSIECIFKLISEIDPSIFATTDVGRNIIQDLRLQIRQAQNHINQQWQELAFGIRPPSQNDKIIELTKQILTPLPP